MDLLALILTVISGATAALTAQHAALLHMRGDVAAARGEIEAVLAKHPSDASALFTAASFEIEAGDLTVASRYVSKLERLSPAPPQARVLAALIARRQRQPQERIDDALIEAWKEVGRPDLASSPLLPPLESWATEIMPPELGPDIRKRMSAAERLVFAYDGPANGREHLKVAFDAATTAEKNPLAVNIEILAALTFFEPMPDEFRDDARRVAARVGPIVRAADPTNGYLALAAWLASGSNDSPVSVEDLALLQDAVAKPRFEVPRREMLAELLQMASRVDAKHGAMRARVAALGAPVPVMRLWKRAEATEEPAVRSRVSTLLAATAKRLESSGTMLERMLALALTDVAARLSGDERRIASVRARVDRGRASMNGMREEQKRLGTWPFAGPWRDWDPAREMEHFGRFAR
jgi:hypothetical protein